MAFSEFDLTREGEKKRLYIGGGSCPYVSGLSASFSESGCLEKTDRFYSSLGAILNGVSRVVFIHRSEYLQEVTLAEYEKLLNESIERLPSDVEFLIVMEPPKLDFAPGRCIRGFGLDCELFYPFEFYERRALISQSFSSEYIVMAKTNASEEVKRNGYKDTVHLSDYGLRSFYPCFVDEGGFCD